jgi:crossover junction endodeoxyribonuclease RuvC
LQNTSNIILGIDPGTVVMGYGLIEVTGNNIRLIDMNVLKLSAKQDAYEKLENIHTKVLALITEYKPASFAIEAPFFGKNVQSMLKLGRAQGVAIAAAMQSGLVVCEYSPKKIKQSVTGNGNADKEQVMKMLQNLLSFTDRPVLMDASDALAVAVCHHFQNSSILKSAASPKAKGWKEFMSANPERIK